MAAPWFHRRGQLTKILAAVAILVAVLVIAIAPPLPGATEATMRTGALTVFAIGFWACGILPIGVTAIAFFLFASLFGLTTTAVVFSGFTSPALWLVFGGLVIGVSVGHTGLGERVAHALVDRLGGGYAAVLAGIAAVSMLLGFVMPSSMGRVVLLVPIVLALADQLGYEAGSRPRTGMVLVTLLMSFSAAGTVLPALVPGVTMAGLAAQLYGIDIGYGSFLAVQFPVMGALRAVTIVALAAWLFAAPPLGEARVRARESATGAQRVLGAVLTVALALWMSDAWHGISPAWVALAAALILLLPGTGLLPPRTLNDQLDWSSVLYVAAVLGLSTMIAGSGLAEVAGGRVLERLALSPGADFVNFATLSVLAGLLCLVVTNPGVPAVLSPLAGDIAASTGLPLETVLMTQVIGFTTVILPFSASPVFVGMAMGRVPLADAAKLTLAVTAVTWVVLLPLNYLWWQLLGMF